MSKCKHDFKTLAGGSGGWKETETIVQCTKCLKVFNYNTDYVKRRFVEVEILEDKRMKTICICKMCRRTHHRGKKAKSFTYSNCEICGLERNCVYISVEDEE